MKLVNFDIGQFLSEYWQKRPMLIRNPWEEWRNPLDPDELAGLACEEGVESRLITWQAGRPELESGPLPEARFAELEGTTCTLLVQAVDHHVPDVAALIAPFRFVPDWRIDDIMVSYAVDGGGVGPHFDQYDVFLVQGLGRRRWRVGPQCDAATPLQPHEDLRLIADFTATDEWVLEPGDILYVPPGFAHDGVAVGDDCMTYSIGFRAPARGELVEGWAQHCADALADSDRYADPDLVQQSNPGEITAHAIGALQAMVLKTLENRDGFARWFGGFSSTPKYPDIDWRPEPPMLANELHHLLANGGALCRNPGSRFAFIRQHDEAVILFVDGVSFDCSGRDAEFAVHLCAAPEAVFAPHNASVTLLLALLNQGSLAFEDAETDKDDADFV